MQHREVCLAGSKRMYFRVVLSIALALMASLAFGDVALANDATSGEGDSAGSESALAKTTVADASTLWNWSELIVDDTSAVGSIWTDKSVSDTDMTRDKGVVEKGDSDFITALSAISSTTSLSSTVSQPLDIVLVLDVSRSMGNNNLGKVTRMEALQTAVKAFIDKLAAENDKISDVNMQHQLALVKFAGKKSNAIGNNFYGNGNNYSQVVMSLGACTSTNKETIKTTVGKLKPGGATNSQAGLELASGITSQRTNAKKVVIFFIDGTPTAEGRGGEWSDDVASGAVTAAQTMKTAKTAGATVYSIGVFGNADPSLDPTDGASTDESTNVLNFMHAVSSNYKDAKFVKATGSRYYSWTFGTRSTDAAGKATTYYKTATDDEGLAQVFDDIASEITTSAGYPTKTIEGLENESGYITFDDELGAYMKVDEVKALAYNGAKYENPTKSTKDNVTTYTFAGDANAGLDATENLKDIVITVTTSDKVSDGDKVQVKIPATMIPLTSYDIDLTANTMAKKAAEPLSVFYTSSLKDEVADLLKNPDEDMQAYLSDESHIDSVTGEVYFYANKWSGKANGDVTASYEPAATNSYYYYFTADTPIYTDEACTTRATSVVSGTTYYYQQNYYKDDGGKAVAATKAVEFPGSVAAGLKDAVATGADGYAYFKAGTPRINHTNELNCDKAADGNTSETASSAANLQWNSTTQASAATTVDAHLGNNGRLSVPLPATLEISKELTIPQGYDAADFANVTFGFTVSIPKAAGQSFSA